MALISFLASAKRRRMMVGSSSLSADDASLSATNHFQVCQHEKALTGKGCSVWRPPCHDECWQPRDGARQMDFRCTAEGRNCASLLNGLDAVFIDPVTLCRDYALWLQIMFSFLLHFFFHIAFIIVRICASQQRESQKSTWRKFCTIQ